MLQVIARYYLSPIPTLLDDLVQVIRKILKRVELGFAEDPPQTRMAYLLYV